MTAVDIDKLCAWIGKTRESTDTIHPGPVAALSATLDHVAPLAGAGDELPPGWHWLYFHEHVPAAAIDEDGHPKRGEFLPPVPLPRRMWAGGELEFLNPVRVGDTLRRISGIEDVSCKKGRSGELVFVTVSHRYLRGKQLCIRERQDLVYREAGAAAPLPVAETEDVAAECSRRVTPDPVLLFRYSALTFNSHRIHYDREYATQVEAYPELVVQGPLTATLLLDALARLCPEFKVSGFSFLGRSALYCGSPITLSLSPGEGGVELLALNEAGVVAMRAAAR